MKLCMFPEAKIGKWDLQAGLRMEATQTTGYSRELDSSHKTTT